MTWPLGPIAPHLPALVVVVPLVGGLLAALLGRRGLGWWIALATSSAVLAVCVALLARVLDAPGAIDYRMGGWVPPFGIAFRVDPLNAGVLTIVAVIAAVTTLYARTSIASEIPADRHRFFYAVWLLGLTGLLGITITGDAFNLYVLLEISSLATYVLVAMGKYRDRRALTASMNYLVLGTIGASFILLGIGYLYSITGTLNMEDLAARLDEITGTWDGDAPRYQRTAITGFAFLIVGLALKLALFPLHRWLPRAYTYAPSAVAALLAATATKVGAYATIRMLYTVLGTDFAFRPGIPVDELLLVAASLAILFGSALALRQENLRCLLAYSSVAQIGYIVIGFAMANQDALAGSIVHLFNHAITKGGMFLALGIVSYRFGVATLGDVRGLGRKLPFTMAAFTVGGLGLIGVPLTAGFVSKWYLVKGAFEAGQPLLAAVILGGSLLTVLYVWRVVEAVYFRPRDAAATPIAPRAGLLEAPLLLVVPTGLLIGASVYFGIDATLTGSISRRAAEALISGGP